MSRREFMKINKGLTAFIAPSTFDPAAQNVNLYTLFRDYSNSNKAFAYTFSDTVNTLTLSSGSGILYTYGYTRGGSDTVVSEVASATNPFLAGDTKRFVIVANTASSITTTLPLGSVWAIVGSKIICVTSQSNTYLKYLHFYGKVNLSLISSSSFASCSGLLGNLTIPSSVSTIEYYAFNNCIGLNGILTLPNRSITFGSNPFLRTLLIFPDTAGGNWEIYDKILYKDLAKSLLVGTGRLKSGSLTIPSSVTTIGEGAFVDCGLLSGSLTIPSSVTTIGISAFYGCSGFTGSLTIPSSVTTIGANAFINCFGFSGALNINCINPTIGISAFAGLLTTALNIAVGYNALATGYNYTFNFNNNQIASNMYVSIMGIVNGTKTITIGTANKNAVIAAYPTFIADYTAKGFTIN